MDLKTEKLVNETIVMVCNLIQEKLKSNSAEHASELPSLIEALAKLIHR